jgi:hypothetical protein
MGATPPSEIVCVLGLHQEMCDKQLNLNGDHRQRIEPTPVGVNDEVNKELIGVLDAASRTCTDARARTSPKSPTRSICVCARKMTLYLQSNTWLKHSQWSPQEAGSDCLRHDIRKRRIHHSLYRTAPHANGSPNPVSNGRAS